MIADWYLHLPAVVQAVIRAILWVLIIFAPIPIFIWWERRLLSWMQDRIGPNRVGNISFSRTSKAVPGFLKGKKFKLYGLIQPLADGAKSFFKEDITPSAVDKFIYTIAPGVALFPPFALGATLPYAPWPTLTPVADVNIGVLYMLAMSSLGVYGVVLAGYGSNNKYSLLGGLRSSAQLISYELSMGMALASVVFASGSLKLSEILKAQEQPLWGVVPALQNWYIFTPFGFVAAIVFLICMVAETNRAPFDLPECESELVAGYNTEYSTKKWVLFMMGEYISMFIFGGVWMTVFFGGYNLLPVNWSVMGEWGTFFKWIGDVQYYGAPAVFMLKGFIAVTIYIWTRATLPRLRYDQLMSLGWKSLLPLATTNFIVVGLWILSTRLISERTSASTGAVLGWVSIAIAIGILAVLYKIIRGVRPGEPVRLEARGIRMVDPVLPVVEVADSAGAA